MTGPVEAFPRLTITGIGAQLDVIVDGEGAPELADQLTRAWHRCIPQPFATPDSPQPNAAPDSPQPNALPAPPTVTPDLIRGLSPTIAEAVTIRIGRGTTEATVSGTDPASVMVAATQAITRSLIAAQTGKLLMFHAGAVCHPITGKAVAYVAPGGTGKTTLSRKLGTRYGYLTDETVAIDSDYRILPYPKPLSTRQHGAPKAEIPPDELGLVGPHAEVTVTRLLLLERSDTHPGKPEVTELALLDAVQELAPQSSALYALDEGLRRCARLIEATGPVLRVRYAEADDLLPLVADLIGDADRFIESEEPHSGPRDSGLDPEPQGQPHLTSTQPPLTHTERPLTHTEGPLAATTSHPASTTSHPASTERHPGLDPGSLPPSLEPDTRIHTRRYADILERAGEALLLLPEGGLLRLSPIGTAIVELAMNPITLETLAGALEHRFGTPEEGSTIDLTAAMTQELGAQGVLDLGEPPRPDAQGPFWRISDDAAFVVSAPDRVVVLNLANPGDQPKALLGSGATIWQALMGPDDDLRPWVGETDLLADLTDLYGTPPGEIDHEARAFLEQLATEGYLKRVDDP